MANLFTIISHFLLPLHFPIAYHVWKQRLLYDKEYILKVVNFTLNKLAQLTS